MIFVQFRYFTLRPIFNTLDNKIIQNQKLSDPWIFSVLNHDACIFKKDVCNLVNPVWIIYNCYIYIGKSCFTKFYVVRIRYTSGHLSDT